MDNERFVHRFGSKYFLSKYVDTLGVYAANLTSNKEILFGVAFAFFEMKWK